MIPHTLVKLGYAIELRMSDGTVWEFTSRDRFCICSNLTGTKLYVFSIIGSKIVKPERSKAISKAEKLWSKWSGFEMQKALRSEVSNSKLSSIGKVSAICYRSDKWSGKKQDYIHSFRHPPTAFANSKSNPSVFEIRGKLKVKKEGITG